MVGGSVGVWARTSAMRDRRRASVTYLFPRGVHGQRRMREGISVGEGFGGGVGKS